MDNQVIRGDTKRWSIALVKADGSALDLTGHTVWFTAKTVISNDPTDSDAIIQHKIVIDGSGDVVSSDGFEVGGIHPVTEAIATTVEEGVLTQTLSPADSTLIAKGNYVYDLQVKTPTGDVYTPILAQTLTVIDDVTRSDS